MLFGGDPNYNVSYADDFSYSLYMTAYNKFKSFTGLNINPLPAHTFHDLEIYIGSFQDDLPFFLDRKLHFVDGKQWSEK